MKFLAKPNTWYDEMTEVEIVDEYCTVYDKDGPPTLHCLCRGLKNGSIDEEICVAEEFIIVGDDY